MPLCLKTYPRGRYSFKTKIITNRQTGAKAPAPEGFPWPISANLFAPMAVIGQWRKNTTVRIPSNTHRLAAIWQNKLAFFERLGSIQDSRMTRESYAYNTDNRVFFVIRQLQLMNLLHAPSSKSRGLTQSYQGNAQRCEHNPRKLGLFFIFLCCEMPCIIVL